MFCHNVHPDRANVTHEWCCHFCRVQNKPSDYFNSRRRSMRSVLYEVLIHKCSTADLLRFKFMQFLSMRLPRKSNSSLKDSYSIGHGFCSFSWKLDSIVSKCWYWLWFCFLNSWISSLYTRQFMRAIVEDVIHYRRTVTDALQAPIGMIKHSKCPCYVLKALFSTSSTFIFIDENSFSIPSMRRLWILQLDQTSRQLL